MLGEAVSRAEAGEVTLQSKGLKKETNTRRWGLLLSLQSGWALAEIHARCPGLEVLLPRIVYVGLYI